MSQLIAGVAAKGNYTHHYSCPEHYNCTDVDGTSDGYVSLDIGVAPSYVALVSSALSCLGSMLIVAAYLALRDMRSGAQKLITMLAMADLLSALGYIMGSVNFLTHSNDVHEHTCKQFQRICEVQAALTSWSSLVSFALTFFLALYFFLSFVCGCQSLASRLMPLYAVVSWVGPLLVVIPLAATKILGYAPYAASNWCFVKADLEIANISSISLDGVVYVLLAGKLWELLTYLSVIILYLLIFCHLCKVCTDPHSLWPITSHIIISICPPPHSSTI